MRKFPWKFLSCFEGKVGENPSDFTPKWRRKEAFLSLRPPPQRYISFLPLFKRKYVSLNGFHLHRHSSSFGCVEVFRVECWAASPTLPANFRGKKIPWNLTFAVCPASELRTRRRREWAQWNRTRVVFERNSSYDSLKGIEFSGERKKEAHNEIIFGRKVFSRFHGKKLSPQLITRMTAERYRLRPMTGKLFQSLNRISRPPLMFHIFRLSSHTSPLI